MNDEQGGPAAGQDWLERSNPATLGWVIAALLLGILFLKALLHPTFTHGILIAGFGLVGLLLGVIGLRLRTAALPEVSRTMGLPQALACAVLSSAILFFFCADRAMVQIGGFDHSILVDTAWRVHIGQRPFVDFPCSLPLGFAYGAGLAFRLFGPSWQSLAIFNAIFATLSALWFCALLVRIFPSQRGFAEALGTAIAFMVHATGCYWWYNPLTISCGICFLLSTADWFQRPGSVIARVSWFISLMLLALSKPNLAGILICGSFAILLLSRRHRLWAFLMGGAALAAFLAILAVIGTDLPRLISAYLGVAGRGAVIGQFFIDASRVEVTLSCLGLLVVLAPLAFAFQRRMPSREDLLLLAISALGLLGGLNSFFADGETKTVNLALCVVSVALLGSRKDGSEARLAGRHWIPQMARSITLIASLAAGLSLGLGLTRHRVLCIGPGTFYTFEAPLTKIETGFFRGVRASRIFSKTVLAIDAVGKEHSGKSFYFGPRIQFGYAQCGIPSPVGQPVWWHPGTAFPAGAEFDLVRKWAAALFDTVVMLGGDTTDFKPGFVALISETYHFSTAHPPLAVGTRKPFL